MRALFGSLNRGGLGLARAGPLGFWLGRVFGGLRVGRGRLRRFRVLGGLGVRVYGRFCRGIRLGFAGPATGALGFVLRFRVIRSGVCSRIRFRVILGIRNFRGRVAIAVVTVGVAIAVVFTVGSIIPVGFATPTPPATTTTLGFPFAIIVIVRAIVLALPAIAVAAGFIVSVVRICFRIDIQIVDLVHDGGINRHHMFDRRDNACRGLELFKREIGADQSGVAFDAHGHAIAAFDMGDMFALLIHQEVGDAHRRGDQYLARPFAGALFLDLAQDRQRKVVVRPDQAGAVAGVARLCRRLDHTGTQTLARHFHQTKAGNTAHLNTRTVGFQLFLHQLFNGGVIATLVHVDKVDDDQTGQIAQTQLAGDFGGGFQVGLGRGLFDGAFLGGPARVHVDGN